MLIKDILPEHLNKIVDIHLNSFDEKHFSKIFPPEMLREYLKLLIELNEYSFAAIVNDEVVGYIIGGSRSTEALNRFKQRFRFQIFLHLIKNPSFIIEKLIETFGYLFPDNIKKTKIRLYLIAVDFEMKGKGIGKELINYLESALTDDGIKKYGLSVRKENQRAIKLYDKIGFYKSGENHKSIFFEKKLKEE